MVNLKAKPYNLDEQGIKWVEETIANMTIEEKIGQLFINMGASTEEEYLKNSLEKLIKDPALRATLAKNAHTTVSQSFSLEKWEERWSLVLNDIKKLS